MVTEYFFNFSCLFVWKNGKNNFSNQEKINKFSSLDNEKKKKRGRKPKKVEFQIEGETVEKEEKNEEEYKNDNLSE